MVKNQTQWETIVSTKVAEKPMIFTLRFGGAAAKFKTSSSESLTVCRFLILELECDRIWW